MLNMYSCSVCYNYVSSRKNIFHRKPMLRQHPSLQCKSTFTDNFNVIIIRTKDTFIGGVRNSGKVWQPWTEGSGGWGVAGHWWTLMPSIVASYRQCYSVNKRLTIKTTLFKICGDGILWFTRYEQPTFRIFTLIRILIGCFSIESHEFPVFVFKQIWPALMGS